MRATRLYPIFKRLLASLITFSIAFGPLAASGQARILLQGKVADSTNKYIQRLTAEEFEALGKDFDTAVGEFRAYCNRLAAGAECSKWPKIRSEGIKSFFSSVIKKLPDSLKKELLRSIAAGISIQDLREKYFQGIGQYIKAVLALHSEMDRIQSQRFKTEGVFLSESRPKIDFSQFMKSHSAQGIGRSDVVDAWVMLNSLKIQRLMTLMYFSTPADSQELVTSNSEINKVTTDPVTKKIMAQAFLYFTRQGIYSKGEAELKAVRTLITQLAQSVPVSHGLWTSDKALASVENVASSLKLAREGKYINVNGVIYLWEQVKSFNINFIFNILKANPTNTVDELLDDKNLLRLGTPDDLGKSLELVFGTPLRIFWRNLTYQQSYFDEFMHQASIKGTEVAKPQVQENKYKFQDWMDIALGRAAPESHVDTIKKEIEFQDFAKIAKENMHKNHLELEAIEKRYQLVIDRRNWDLHKVSAEARAKAKSDVDKLKNSTPRETGAKAFDQAKIKLIQWGLNYLDIFSGSFQDIQSGNKLGTHGSEALFLRHESMLRNYNSSVFGTNAELALSNGVLPVIGQLFGTPLLSAAETIGASVTMVDDGYIETVRNIYGLSAAQYDEKMKTDAGFQRMKLGFDIAVGGGALLLTAGAGGVIGGAVSAGRAAAVAGFTMRTASSILLKPAMQAGVILAKRSVQPLSAAFGLGGIFSISSEMTEAGSPGGKWDWARLGKNTASGARDTLIFMSGMTGIAKMLAFKGASQSTIFYTSASIDVIESSGDWQHTLDLWRRAQSPLQTGGAALALIGNIFDSGDSAWTIARSMGAQSQGASASEKSKFEQGQARVDAAIRIFNRVLTPTEAQAIRSMNPKAGGAKFRSLMASVKMTPKDAWTLSRAYGLWESNYNVTPSKR